MEKAEVQYGNKPGEGLPSEPGSLASHLHLVGERTN